MRQTEALRTFMYISAPFARSIPVPCVWCGEPAGNVNILDPGECELWIKRGKLCPACYEMEQETSYE
jgi:hypothetical protein